MTPGGRNWCIGAGQGESGQAGAGAEGVESGLQVFVPDDLVDDDRAAVVGEQRPVERVAELAGVDELLDGDAQGGAVPVEVQRDDRVSGRLRAAL